MLETGAHLGVRNWMKTTEFMWCGSRASLKKIVNNKLSLRVGSDVITPVNAVHDFGVTLNSELTMQRRVVKRSSDLWTSNFKFEFIFVFQPFDIRIQASLIRHRRFCLESGALQRCTVWPFLCSLPAVNSSDARRVFAYPFPPLPSLHTAAAFNYSPSCTVSLASYQSDKSWWPRHRADINRWQ